MFQVNIAILIGEIVEDPFPKLRLLWSPVVMNPTMEYVIVEAKSIQNVPWQELGIPNIH